MPVDISVLLNLSSHLPKANFDKLCPTNYGNCLKLDVYKRQVTIHSRLQAHHKNIAGVNQFQKVLQRVLKPVGNEHPLY